MASLCSSPFRATTSAFRSAGRNTSVRTMATKQDVIKSTISDNKVVIYSKTYCPYCTRAKGLMQKLNVPATVFELDNMSDGAELQNALTSITGSRTVPQVFIGGKFIGGCDDTHAAYNSGKLKEALAGVGISI